jgi:hypothetical protein
LLTSLSFSKIGRKDLSNQETAPVLPVRMPRTARGEGISAIDQQQKSAENWGLADLFNAIARALQSVGFGVRTSEPILSDSTSAAGSNT